MTAGGSRPAGSSFAPLLDRWRPIVRAASRVVPVALVVFVAVEWNGIAGQDRDTVAYYKAASAARSGGAIYEPLPPPGPHEFVGGWHYLYPPPLAALLAPVARLEYRTFDRAWLLLNVLAFWVLAASLARISGGAWSQGSVARWGAALFFLPGTLLAIHFGNIELIILALVGTGLAVPAVAGAVIGLAALLKVAPGWALLVLAIRRPKMTLPPFLAAVAVSAGACVIAFGVRGSIALSAQWLRDVMPSVGQGQFWGESLGRLQEGGLGPTDYLGNLSLSFLPVQLAVLAGWWDYAGGPLPGPVAAYLFVVAIGAPLLTAWLTRRRAAPVQATATLAVAMVSAPIVRPYALPVFVLLLAALRREQQDQAVADAAPRPADAARVGS